MRVLLTNNSFRSFQGSELVTLELAEYFIGRGDEVVLYTNLAGDPITAELVPLETTGRFQLISDPQSDLDPAFDLIWMHHHLLPPTVVEALRRGLKTAVVWHHMSSFVEIELPLLADIEESLTDRISAVSDEVAATLREYGIKKKIDRFSNPAPEAFFTQPLRQRPSTGPESVLVVSNHPPAEVIEAMALLSAQGIRAEHAGDGGAPRRISAALLNSYDAVLTIGKTVQYALPLGLPVYEYDHFGGPGWLSKANFAAEAARNFSGRATREQRTATQIADEIVRGYPAALDFAEDAADHPDPQHRLSSAVEAQLSRLGRRRHPKRLSAEQALRLAAFNRLHKGLHVAATLYFDSVTRR